MIGQHGGGQGLYRPDYTQCNGSRDPVSYPGYVVSIIYVYMYMYIVCDPEPTTIF